MNDEFSIETFCRDMKAYLLFKRQLSASADVAESLVDAGFLTLEEIANAPASRLHELLEAEDAAELQAKARSAVRSAAPPESFAPTDEQVAPQAGCHPWRHLSRPKVSP